MEFGAPITHVGDENGLAPIAEEKPRLDIPKEEPRRTETPFKVVVESGPKAESNSANGVTHQLADGKNSKPGWKLIESKWYYYDHSDKAKTGWVKDGAWYYLDETGVMQTG